MSFGGISVETERICFFMDIANRIYWQKINDIQNRIPVPLNLKKTNPNEVGKIQARPITTIPGNESEAVDFQTLLDEKIKEATPAVLKETELSGSMKYIYELIDGLSEKYNVDPNLIKGIIKAESNFDPGTVSSAGAMGIMQLMPEVVQMYRITDPFDIEQNMNGGIQLIGSHLQKYNGDVASALAAYHAGSGNVSKFNNNPTDFPNTKKYVENVMKYASEYNNL